MNINHYFGADRERIGLNSSLTDEAVVRHGAFHGIISRGLLEGVQRIAPRRFDEWDAVAPLLEGLLTGRTTIPAQVNSRPDRAQLRRWLRLARDKRVLTFDTSADVARRYAQQWVEQQRLAPTRVDLWFVKEGHTASVWQVNIACGGQHPAHSFCLNVARDASASRELSRSFEYLARLHRRDRRAVEVMDVAELSSPQGAVSVAATTWLDGAQELHLVPGDQTGIGRFFAVERFLYQRTSMGGLRRSLRGRSLDAESNAAAWRTYLAFICAHSELKLDRGVVDGPALEINEGDMVLTSGGVRIVALCEPELEADLGTWILRLVATSAAFRSGAPQQRLYWGSPEIALDVITQSLAHKPAAVLNRCLLAALKLDHNAQQLAVPNEWQRTRALAAIAQRAGE